MNKKIENLLLSLLLLISVLLGLSFWLNTIFNFNLFSANHWQILAQLQANHTSIRTGFYVSIGIAIFIFIIGLYFIYHIKLRKIFNHSSVNKITHTPTVIDNTIIQQNPITNATPNTIKPKRLNLPKNIASIAQNNYITSQQPQKSIQISSQFNTEFDDEIKDIFSNNGFTIKKSPKIKKFTPNIFAIGTNEVVWIGAVNIDIDTLQNAINTLQDIFVETLEDIPIHINAFLLDTNNMYQDNQTQDIVIFHTIDSLAQFIQNIDKEEVSEDTQDNFNAYSEYMDTVIQYINKI